MIKTETNEESNNEIFWLDKWEGKAHGGIFMRNPLFEIIERAEKQGKKIVGIKKPTGWNLELIYEELHKTPTETEA